MSRTLAVELVKPAKKPEDKDQSEAVAEHRRCSVQALFGSILPMARLAVCPNNNSLDLIGRNAVSDQGISKLTPARLLSGYLVRMTDLFERVEVAIGPLLVIRQEIGAGVQSKVSCLTGCTNYASADDAENRILGVLRVATAGAGLHDLSPLVLLRAINELD